MLSFAKKIRYMIKSMTGYGNHEFLWQGNHLSVQIRSLNSKGTDVRINLPEVLRYKESEILKLIQNTLRRGKIDFRIDFEDETVTDTYTLNTALIKKYYAELKEIKSQLNLTNEEEDFAQILNLPEAVIAQKSEFSDENWGYVLEAINVSLEKVVHFQVEEGKSLYADIRKSIERIMELLVAVSPFEERRIDKIRKRLYERIENISIDENRYEQEVMFYLDKLDINEEKVRLRKHCEYFIEILDTPESQGKKLGFIAQEILREINTLGSKANDADIQRIVVNMKSEQEKVKEQLGNVL